MSYHRCKTNSLYVLCSSAVRLTPSYLFQLDAAQCLYGQNTLQLRSKDSIRCSALPLAVLEGFREKRFVVFCAKNGHCKYGQNVSPCNDAISGILSPEYSPKKYERYRPVLRARTTDRRFLNFA